LLIVDFARVYAQVVVVFSKSQYLIDYPHQSNMEEKDNGTT
jgi:hypothetical protein